MWRPEANKCAMSALARPLTALETALFRRGVAVAHAQRDCCRHCRRTPLVGERVHFYGAELVCDLCRFRRRESPDASRLMHSPEHDRAVRVLDSTA